MRPFKYLVIMLIIGLLAAACTSAATPTTTTVPQSTSAPTTALQPTSAPAQAPAEQKLTVFAAASLTDVFNEIGEQFKQQNPGVTLSSITPDRDNCARSWSKAQWLIYSLPPTRKR